MYSLEKKKRLEIIVQVAISINLKKKKFKAEVKIMRIESEINNIFKYVPENQQSQKLVYSKD